MPTSVKTKGMASFFTGLLKGIGESRYKQYLQDLQEKSRLQEIQQQRLTEVASLASKEMVDPEAPEPYRKQATEVYNAAVRGELKQFPSRPNPATQSLKDQLTLSQIGYYKARTETATALADKYKRFKQWAPARGAGSAKTKEYYSLMLQTLNSDERSTHFAMEQLKDQWGQIPEENITELERLKGDLITIQNERLNIKEELRLLTPDATPAGPGTKKDIPGF